MKYLLLLLFTISAVHAQEAVDQLSTDVQDIVDFMKKQKESPKEVSESPKSCNEKYAVLALCQDEMEKIQNEFFAAGGNAGASKELKKSLLEKSDECTQAQGALRSCPSYKAAMLESAKKQYQRYLEEQEKQKIEEDAGTKKYEKMAEERLKQLKSKSDSTSVK